MIQVKVKTILDFRNVFGTENKIELPEDSTLASLLEAMAYKWGDEFATAIFKSGSNIPMNHIRLIINGRDIAFLDRLETQLKQGDEVLILPPVSGG